LVPFPEPNWFVIRNQLPSYLGVRAGGVGAKRRRPEHVPTGKSVPPIIEYLLGAGVMADELIKPKDPTEVLLREYEEYLVTQRSLAVASAPST
jgi:hypothetical protein